ncbi:UDP-4-amino-4,6-dideoxy-N-acetyl-beta-L-altrosamine transaminase [Thermodesulfobacteriota bacterium]
MKFSPKKSEVYQYAMDLIDQSPFIPYGRQCIDEEDIQAVVAVLRSDLLTTGPKVQEFEQAVADYVGVKYAVAVNSGTAALHCAMYALGIGTGDEVIVPPMTFAATVNSIVYQGAKPVFVDVDPETLLIDPEKVDKKISNKTRSIIAVDYAGQPCEYDLLVKMANEHNLTLIGDGCHALGADYKGRKVGSLADMTIFSFHPVKNITTGEGGMITTDNLELADRARIFRNHGITRDPKCFSTPPSDLRPLTSEFSWYYEMLDLGYNYRISDIQCALGLSQLKKLPSFLKRRQEIARRYDEAFAGIPGITPLAVRPDVLHAYHLYVIKADYERLKTDRTGIFQTLREKGIGLNVHYVPVHLQPFYKNKFNTGQGLCPAAEAAYEQIISIPLFPGMTDEDMERVIAAVIETTKK